MDAGIAACLELIDWKWLASIVAAIATPILAYIGRLHAQISGLNSEIHKLAIANGKEWAEHSRWLASMRRGDQ